jgi:hypothetical protein
VFPNPPAPPNKFPAGFPACGAPKLNPPLTDAGATLFVGAPNNPPPPVAGVTLPDPGALVVVFPPKPPKPPVPPAAVVGVVVPDAGALPVFAAIEKPVKPDAGAAAAVADVFPKLNPPPPPPVAVAAPNAGALGFPCGVVVPVKRSAVVVRGERTDLPVFAPNKGCCPVGALVVFPNENAVRVGLAREEGEGA